MKKTVFVQNPSKFFKPRTIIFNTDLTKPTHASDKKTNFMKKEKTLYIFSGEGGIVIFLQDKVTGS